MQGELPNGFAELLNAYIGRTQAEGKALATRQASQAALNAIGPSMPELLGGSADLTPSNGTWRKDSVVLTPESPGGNYLHFGVREFGMSAMLNGIVCHGGFIPYAGTFLTFSDYARNAVRMAALMRLRVIFVYTHDSIGLGEDGPTHQPIEHLASLRLIPHMDLWRPCDAVETAAAWGVAIENRDGPTCLVFTRQSVVHEAREAAQVAAIRRGGYVLIDSAGAPEAIVIATGSEVGIAAEAVRTMAGEGQEGPIGVDAEHQHLRRPGRCIQAKRAAAVGHAARGGRGRRDRAMVALCRLAGRDRRHRSFRRISPRQGRIQSVRFHGGTCRGSDRESTARHNGENMAIRVAINGYGRIGRNIMRALYEGKHAGEIKVVAINDLGDANTNVHLTRFDTVHGRFRGDVHVDGDSMVVNGDRIRVVAQRDPSKLPWGELGADFVLECTGLFTSKAKASAHIAAGAKKVVISAPGGDDVDATVVYGVNHDVLKASHTVISNASCTTNCLAPLVKVLHDKVGILAGVMNTIHSYTNDQVLDRRLPHRSAPRALRNHVHDPDQDRRRRRGRSGAAGTQGQDRRLCDSRADDQCFPGRPELHRRPQDHGRGNSRRHQGRRRRCAQGHPGLQRCAAGVGGFQPRPRLIDLRRHADQGDRGESGQGMCVVRQ